MPVISLYYMQCYCELYTVPTDYRHYVNMCIKKLATLPDNSIYRDAKVAVLK